jgi:hypothetical protein
VKKVVLAALLKVPVVRTWGRDKYLSILSKMGDEKCDEIFCLTCKSAQSSPINVKVSPVSLSVPEGTTVSEAEQVSETFALSLSAVKFLGVLITISTLAVSFLGNRRSAPGPPWK